MNAFAMQAWTPEFERQNPRISLKARRSSTGICNPVHPLEMAETRDSPEPQRPAHRVYTGLAPRNRGRPYTRCDSVPALCLRPGLLLSTRKMNSKKGQ